MNPAILAFLIILITSTFATAHGDEAPGPHGGHIQMPANFHTEVIAKDDQTFHIYLTDMEFKNPLTTSSEVKVSHLVNGKKTSLKCRSRKNYFICQKNQKMTSGTLIIQATRNKIVATSEARYELPLKPF